MWLVLTNLKSHVFFQLCDQIILHCVKDILEAKLIDFYWKITLTYFISVRCITTNKFECFNDWYPITAAKWQKMLKTISGTEKTFNDFVL